MKLQSNDLHQSVPARAFSLGPAAKKVVVVALFAVLLLLYLAQSTQGATRQYEVRSLEDTLSTATQDREALQLESVRLQSLSAVAPVAPAATPAPNADQKTDQKAQSSTDKPVDPASIPSLVPAQHIDTITTESH